jgi:hypothetical protein
MPQKRQSPGKRANATRANYLSTHREDHNIGTRSVSRFAQRSSLHHRGLLTYSRLVAANSATGFDRSINNRRNSAPETIAGAFFALVISFYGGCAWEAFGSAGFLLSRSVNPRTAATPNRLTAIGGSSPAIGATPMTLLHALNPSLRSSRAAAHKAMAFAALHANSSLATRLSRFNHHMQLSRLASAEPAPSKEVRHV